MEARRRDRFHGAMLDLSRVVRTHLFVLSANSGGSTFLARAIGRSRHVWSLYAEGQNVFGYRGPSTAGEPHNLLFAAREAWIEIFRRPESYDWETTRRAWYFQATAGSPDAEVFVTKTPQFLLMSDLLAENFVGARFVIMVRNPYATVEGILRARRHDFAGTRGELIEIAARHVATALARQADNIETHHAISCHVSYEGMCAEPERTAEGIRTLVPELDDLDLAGPVPVKGRYFEPLRDMNADHIARLGPEDLRRMNRVFRPRTQLLRTFGYDLVDV